MIPPLLAVGLAAAIALPACSRAPSPERPERIVLIVVDTLRRDHVRAYGGTGRN